LKSVQKTASVQVIFSKKKFYENLTCTSPKYFFHTKKACGPARSNFHKKIFFCWKLLELMQFFVLISNMLFILFLNPHISTKLWMKIYKCEKTMKNACNRNICLKKLNKPAVISPRYFNIRRCSFSRAIFWRNQISGTFSYFDPTCHENTL
jgi:hypothetical protein